jgi:hypothetical protein
MYKPKLTKPYNKVNVIITMSLIGLFSIGSFIYHIITADKIIGLISVLAFAIVIIVGIFIPLYTPTIDGEQINKTGGLPNEQNNQINK